MRYIGIDPGLSGAIAVMDDGKMVAVHDMPTQHLWEKGFVKRAVDLTALARCLRAHMLMDDCVVALEKVHAMGGQGVSSMFSLGMSFWGAAGVCAGLGIEVTLVEPKTWKQHYRLGRDKEQSLQVARKVFPAARDRLTRAKDHNRAEALFLACYMKHVL